MLDSNRNPSDTRRSRAVVQLVASILRSMRRRLPQLLGFEVAVSLIALAVVIPLSTWLSTRLISTTGHLAVANEEIVAFLFRPAGLLVLLVVAVTELAARMARLSGPMVIDASARSGGEMTAFGALSTVTRLLPRLIWIGLLMVGRFLLVAGPLAAIAAFVAIRLLSERDIYYYVTIRPTEFWIAASVASALGAIILLVAVVMLARWVFAVPVLLFEGAGGRSALSRSRELSRGSFWRLVALLVVWSLAFALLASGVSFVGERIAGLAVAAFGGSLELFVAAFGLILAVYVATLFVLDIASSLTLALIVFHLYLDLVGESVAAAPTPVAAAESAAGAAHRGAGATHRAASGSPWLWRAAVLALVAIAVSLSVKLVERVNLRDEIEITAHRGSSLRAPENSLAAIELAIAEGADYAEIDVQETADGVIVVLHDRDLKRVTGVSRGIWEVTYAELQDLDAGSWFSDEFGDQRVPTLQQVIDAARGRIVLNIELKFNGHDVALAARTVELIRQNGAEDKVIVTSLDFAGLEEVGRLDTDIRRGFIVARSIGNPWSMDVQLLAVQTVLVEPSTAPRAHRNGMQVHAWTANDPAEISRLIDLGVDNIMTDDPLVAREVLAERAELTDVERLVLYIRNRLAS